MRYFERKTIIMYLVVSCVCLQGCINLYSYKPVTVRVVDAETNAPIPNVNVWVGYDAMFSWPCPKRTIAITDEKGEAILRIANFRGGGLSLQAGNRNGYLDHGAISRDGHRVPAEFRVPAKEGKNDIQAEIRLYREPKPKLKIIIPDGYRGPLKIHLRPKSSYIQEHIGQREFTFTSSENGYVGIDAAPLLVREGSFNIDAHYANGEKIVRYPKESKDTDLLLRWVTCNYDGTKALFVVGTKSDYDAIHAVVYHYIGGSPNHVRSNREAFSALFDVSKEY